jgi:acetoin utilization protein AcuC
MPKVTDRPASTLVVWDDALLEYDFGYGHPLRPVRLELAMALARSLGVLENDSVTVARPEVATEDLLALVHDPAYIGGVKRAPDDVFGRLSLRYGLGTEDNPIFPGMHEAGSLITGGSLTAARAVWEGRVQHAVNLAGGLHHAMRTSASGFCVYNDPAVAIAWLLDVGAQRVAYVDVDVHHGDGVQAAFYDDPRVMTISLHQSGRTLFPGTGYAYETGRGDAEGTSVNVALPPGTTDRQWLRAFSAVVPPVLRAFEPEVLVTQSGCDTHATDPLAELALTVDGQTASYEALHALAHELCGGRWIALGGGGYQHVGVVPRAWTGLLAVAAGNPLPRDTALPQSWQVLVRERVPRAVPPGELGEGGDTSFAPWDAGEGDPDDPVDMAVGATRRAVLPLHGLDPLSDW